MEIEDYAYQIRFSNQFDKSLDIILQYLKEHSYPSFGNFKFDIVSKTSAICENPEAFPLLTKIKTHKKFRYAKIMGIKSIFIFRMIG